METYELSLYTGNLTYRGVDFSFAFDGKELRLIPPEDKKLSIHQDWTMTELKPGVYILSDPTPIEEEYIIGACNETGSKLIFFPDKGNYLSFYNYSICVPLSSYMLCKYDRNLFDRITFYGPELNHIHPVKTGVSLHFDNDKYTNGIVSVSTEGFDVTTTEKQVFYVDGKQVSIRFGISREASLSNDEPPINIRSTMIFEFEACDDYGFILELLRIAQIFVSFLCYRKNVYFSLIQIAAPYKDGRHENYATFISLDQDNQIEDKPIREGRCIKQSLIAGHEGEILSDIAKNLLYIRHFPESYLSGRHIDVGRFILLVTAFEWEFSRLFKNCVIEKDPVRLEAEKAVDQELNTLLDKYKKTGDKEIDTLNCQIRAVFHNFQKHVSDIILQDKVMHVGQNLNELIECFGKPYYTKEKLPFKYDDIGDRLGKQRNHFAHGDIDKDFIGESLIDLIFLENIIYVMQLKYYKIDDLCIKKAVSDLFHRNIVV